MAVGLTKLMSYTSSSIAHHIKTYALWRITHRDWPRLALMQIQQASKLTTSSNNVNTPRSSLVENSRVESSTLSHGPDKLRFKLFIPEKQTHHRPTRKTSEILKCQHVEKTYPEVLSKSGLLKDKKPINSKENRPKKTKSKGAILPTYLKCVSNKTVCIGPDKSKVGQKPKVGGKEKKLEETFLQINEHKMLDPRIMEQKDVSSGLKTNNMPVESDATEIKKEFKMSQTKEEETVPNTFPKNLQVKQESDQGPNSSLAKGVNNWLSAVREHMAEAEQSKRPKKSKKSGIKKSKSGKSEKPRKLRFLSKKELPEKRVPKIKKTKMSANKPKIPADNLSKKGKYLDENIAQINKQPVGFQLKGHFQEMNEILAKNSQAVDNTSMHIDQPNIANAQNKVHEMHPGPTETLSGKNGSSSEVSASLRKKAFSKSCSEYKNVHSTETQRPKKYDENNFNAVGLVTSTPIQLKYKTEASEDDKAFILCSSGSQIVSDKPTKVCEDSKNDAPLKCSESVQTGNIGRNQILLKDNPHLAQPGRPQPQHLTPDVFEGVKVSRAFYLMDDGMYGNSIFSVKKRKGQTEKFFKNPKDETPSTTIVCNKEKSGGDEEIKTTILEKNSVPSIQESNSYWAKVVEETLASMQSLQEWHSNTVKQVKADTSLKVRSTAEAEKSKREISNQQNLDKIFEEFINARSKKISEQKESSKSKKNVSYFLPFFDALSKQQSKLSSKFFNGLSSTQKLRNGNTSLMKNTKNHKKEIRSKSESRRNTNHIKTHEDPESARYELSVAKKSTSFSEPLLFVKPEEIVTAKNRNLVGISNGQGCRETQAIDVPTEDIADHEMWSRVWLGRMMKYHELSSLTQSSKNKEENMPNLIHLEGERLSKKGLHSQKEQKMSIPSVRTSIKTNSPTCVDGLPKAKKSKKFSRNFGLETSCGHKENVYQVKGVKEKGHIGANGVLYGKDNGNRNRDSISSSLSHDQPNQSKTFGPWVETTQNYKSRVGEVQTKNKINEVKTRLKEEPKKVATAPIQKATKKEKRKQKPKSKDLRASLAQFKLNDSVCSDCSRLSDASNLPIALPSDTAIENFKVPTRLIKNDITRIPRVEETASKFKEIDDAKILEEWIETKEDSVVANLMENGVVYPSGPTLPAFTKSKSYETAEDLVNKKTTASTKIERSMEETDLPGILRDNKSFGQYRLDHGDIARDIHQDIQKTYLRMPESEVYNQESNLRKNANFVDPFSSSKNCPKDQKAKEIPVSQSSGSLGQVCGDGSADLSNNFKKDEEKGVDPITSPALSKECGLDIVDVSKKYRFKIPSSNLDGFVTMELKPDVDDPDVQNALKSKISPNSEAFAQRRDSNEANHTTPINQLFMDLHDEQPQNLGSVGKNHPRVCDKLTSDVDKRGLKIDVGIKDALKGSDLRGNLAEERLIDHRQKQFEMIALYEKNIRKYEAALERYRDKLRQAKHSSHDETVDRQPRISQSNMSQVKDGKLTGQKPFKYFEV